MGANDVCDKCGTPLDIFDYYLLTPVSYLAVGPAMRLICSECIERAGFPVPVVPTLDD